jgi:hypothetical protein
MAINILRHIALLLGGLGVAVVVAHADAGRAVQVADDFDLVGWCAWEPSESLRFLNGQEAVTYQRMALTGRPESLRRQAVVRPFEAC